MSAALPTPLDVRLMNATASALFVALAALGLAAVLWWGLRHPMFSIVAIQVQGDLTHNNAVTLRANVAHRLSGNLFTLDLAAARTAFEGVPWVRKALVRREFPNRLNVQLQVPDLTGDATATRFVNSLTEVRAEVARRLQSVVAGKKRGHGINDPLFVQPARPMSAIGG